MTALGIILIVLGIVILIVLSSSIKIVRQSDAIVVERLGKYHKTLDTGLHFIIPFFDRCGTPISLKEIAIVVKFGFKYSHTVWLSNPTTEISFPGTIFFSARTS